MRRVVRGGEGKRWDGRIWEGRVGLCSLREGRRDGRRDRVGDRIW